MKNMDNKQLHSNYTFGFEFEGFAKIEKFLGNIEDYDYYNCSNWDELECNGLDEDDYRKLYTNVNNFINKYFNSDKGRTHYDGSVKNYLDGYQSFEYSSPIFHFIPKDILKIKKFFNLMESNGFGINKTCGFHTHISYPNISEQEALWIVSQIAMDESKINELSHFHYNNSDMDFYSERYASKDFFNEIKNCILKRDFDNLHNYLNDEKYRVIRIHPQGTLEWRGPRNFLNLNKGIDLYFEKLNRIISIIEECRTAESIDGMAKEEFFKNIKNTLKTLNVFDTKLSYNSKLAKRSKLIGLVYPFGKKVDKNFYYVGKKIAKYISKNPLKILDVDYIPYYNAIKGNVNFDMIEKYIQDNNISIDKESQKHLINIFPQFIDCLSNDIISQLDIYTILNIIDNLNIKSTEDTKTYNRIIKILANINDSLKYDCACCFVNNYVWTINPIIELIKQGSFKNIDMTTVFSKYINSYLFYMNNPSLTSKLTIEYPYSLTELLAVANDLTYANLTTIDTDYLKTTINIDSEPIKLLLQLVK